MKKYSLMALAMGLFLAAGNALAAASAPKGVLQDSAWLANDSVLSKEVGQPNSGGALGSIIVWTDAGMPPDADNWRECNGQILNGTAVCKRLGICTAPDYRGRFLRGIGGKAGGLGRIQKAAIPQDMGKGSISNVLTVRSGSASGMARANHVASAPLAWDWGSEQIYSFDLDITRGTNVQRADELRPENMGVRYLIKVN